MNGYCTSVSIPVIAAPEFKRGWIHEVNRLFNHSTTPTSDFATC